MFRREKKGGPARPGLFDPVSIQQYTKIPFDRINDARAQASSLDAARQSLVLMKNGERAPILPLSKGRRLALIGRARFFFSPQRLRSVPTASAEDPRRPRRF